MEYIRDFTFAYFAQFAMYEIGFGDRIYTENKNPNSINTDFNYVEVSTDEPLPFIEGAHINIDNVKWSNGKDYSVKNVLHISGKNCIRNPLTDTSNLEIIDCLIESPIPCNVNTLCVKNREIPNRIPLKSLTVDNCVSSIDVSPFTQLTELIINSKDEYELIGLEKCGALRKLKCTSPHIPKIPEFIEELKLLMTEKDNDIKRLKYLHTLKIKSCASDIEYNDNYNCPNIKHLTITNLTDDNTGNGVFPNGLETLTLNCCSKMPFNTPFIKKLYLGDGCHDLQFDNIPEIDEVYIEKYGGELKLPDKVKKLVFIKRSSKILGKIECDFLELHKMYCKFNIEYPQDNPDDMDMEKLMPCYGLPISHDKNIKVNSLPVINVPNVNDQ